MSTLPLLRLLQAVPVVLAFIPVCGQSPAGVPVRYHFDKAGMDMTSNVRLNEINARAFRHFRKLCPGVTGESWIRTDKEYIVSYAVHTGRSQVHFDLHGAYLYTVKYYGAEDLDRDLRAMLMRRFPDYQIRVVTEIADGEKVYYLVKIENSSSVKTVSLMDGRLEITEELINGVAVRGR